MRFLLFVVVLALVGHLEARKRCVQQLSSDAIPVKYETGPIAASKDYIFWARGGKSCKTKSDVWRFEKATQKLESALQYPIECNPIRAASLGVSEEYLYLSSVNGSIFKVNVQNFTVESSLTVRGAKFTTSIVDENEQFGYFVDESNKYFNQIYKVNLTSLTIEANLSLPESSLGQIKPFYHKEKNEIFFFAFGGILRVDVNTFTKVKTEILEHGSVFSHGPKDLAVTSIGRSHLSLYNLQTLELVESPLDTLTSNVGTPWLTYWLHDLNLLLVIYDLGTYKYKFELIDMESYTIIDDGPMENPTSTILVKLDAGHHDIYDTTVLIRFMTSQTFLSLDMSKCPMAKSKTPKTVDTTPNENTNTNTNTNIWTRRLTVDDNRDREILLRNILVVGCVVAFILTVLIIIGIVYLMKRVYQWKSISLRIN